MSRPQDKARHHRPYLVKALESLSDNDALQCKELYDRWEADTWYDEDKRLYYGTDGNLYKVRQGHTSSSLYPPGSQGSEALYVEVAEQGQGTIDNPIPYNNNMELEEGKYYIQYDVEYYCFRNTGTAVYNDLSALVGIYVEVVE